MDKFITIRNGDTHPDRSNGLIHGTHRIVI